MRVGLPGRLGTLDDVDKALEYLASDLAGFISASIFSSAAARPPDTCRGESLLKSLIVTTSNR